MALQEAKVIDQITVTENGVILYREATRILRDGEQIAQTYHRTSLTPGQDLIGQPANVAAIANVAWTDEVVAAYQAAQETASISQ
jgi:DNA-binding transcriptional LysR family regulator